MKRNAPLTVKDFGGIDFTVKSGASLAPLHLGGCTLNTGEPLYLFVTTNPDSGSTTNGIKGRVNFRFQIHFLVASKR